MRLTAIRPGWFRKGTASNIGPEGSASLKGRVKARERSAVRAHTQDIEVHTDHKHALCQKSTTTWEPAATKRTRRTTSLLGGVRGARALVFDDLLAKIQKSRYICIFYCLILMRRGPTLHFHCEAIKSVHGGRIIISCGVLTSFEAAENLQTFTLVGSDPSSSGHAKPDPDASSKAIFSDQYPDFIDQIGAFGAN